MKLNFKSNLKALLACAMMLQVGVISAKAADLPQIEAAKIANVESDKTGPGYSATKLIDGDKTTNGRWETDYKQDVTNRMPVTITFTLDGIYNVGKVILYTDTNKGAPTDFTVSTSKDNATWTTGTNKTVTQDEMSETGATPLEVTFTPEEAKYVKVVVNHSTASANDYNPADGFLKLAEVELFGELSDSADTVGLQALYDEVNAMAQGMYTDATWQALMAAKDAAKDVLDNNPTDKEAVENAKQALRDALNGLKDNRIANTSIVNKEGPQQESSKGVANAFDGNLDTGWETPYDAARPLPHDLIMTLDGTYDLQQVIVKSTTSKSYLLTQYEIFVSATEDGDDWQSVKDVTIDVSNAASVPYVESKEVFSPIKAKRVKLTLKAGNNNSTFVFIGQVELYGNVNKSDLTDAITEAEKKAAQTTVYTAVSIAALQSVIDAANVLKNNDSATAAQISEQITKLSDAIKALVRLADKTALKAKLDEVIALDTTGKTPNSVQALQDAITAAQTVYNNPQAIQAEADEQVTKLTEAANKLVDKANVSALDTAIKAAQAEITKTDVYTEASINAVQDIIDEATDLMNDENATQEAVDAEVTKLNNAVAAMDKIGEVVNKTPLADLIADAKTEAAKTDVYTAESIATLQQAIADAEAIMDSLDSNAAVQAQVDLLQAAIDALEEKGNTPDPTPVDKSELVKAIEAAKAEVSKTDVYTAESIAALQQAIDDAEAIMDSLDSSAAVQAQVDLLQAAIDALEEKADPEPTPVDKSELVKAIEAAKAEVSKTDVYTAESIAALQKAIADAEAVNKDENAAETDVNTAIKAINDAVKGLAPVEKPNPDEDWFEAIDSETGIRVSAPAGVIDPNAALVVKPINAANVNENVAAALTTLGGKQLAYDITLLLNGVEIQPNGTINIYMEIPKGYFGYKNFQIYHISDDGKVEKVLFRGAGTPENGGGANIQVDHLSVFVLVVDNGEIVKPNHPIENNPLTPSNPVKDTAAGETTPNTGDNTMAMTYVMLLVCAGAFLVFAYKRKDNEA